MDSTLMDHGNLSIPAAEDQRVVKEGAGREQPRVEEHRVLIARKVVDQLVEGRIGEWQREWN
jgi:hypothetical protein